MAEALLAVYILIAYIYAAYKADLAVNDHYLSMITVIHNDADDGNEFIERHGLDAVTAQGLIIICRQIIRTSDVVVYDTHIDPLRDLAAQNIEHGIPHLPRIYDKILEENEFFRLFKLRQQVCIHILADGEIGRFRIAARSVAAVGLKISENAAHACIVDLIDDRRAQGIVPPCFLNLNVKLIAHNSCRPLIAEQNVHKAAEQRQKCDKQHPADLIRRIHIIFYDVQYGDNAQYTQDIV